MGSHKVSKIYLKFLTHSIKITFCLLSKVNAYYSTINICISPSTQLFWSSPNTFPAALQAHENLAPFFTHLSSQPPLSWSQG